MTGRGKARPFQTRDAQILEFYERPNSLRATAAAFGLSHERIRQILPPEATRPRGITLARRKHQSRTP